MPLLPDDKLRVRVVQSHGQHPTDGDYVRTFYMGALGPTSTALLQLLAYYGTRTWRAGDIASRLGVSKRAQNHANNPLGRSLDRLEKFKFVVRSDDGYTYVRDRLPRVDVRHVSRMSDELRAEHASWVAQEVAV